MKAADLRELTFEELQAKLKEVEEELFNLRFQLASQQLENTALLKTIRRDIARLKTVLREKVGAGAAA
jgi:large subunit ribosomal protein L29